MAFCHNCGKKINEEGEFCSECGTKITSKREIKEGHHKESTPKQNKSNWIILAIACFFIVLIGGLLIIRGGKEPVKSTDVVSSPSSQQNQQSPQPRTYCGDGNCQSDESCSSCPSDCGRCQQETIQKKCKTVHTRGGWFSEMYDIPSGVTYWIENVCGFEINGVFDESNSRVSNRYCQANILVDEYFTCESNQCVSNARRFNCASLASNGKCYDGSSPRIGWGRPECYYVDSSGEWQVISTN